MISKKDKNADRVQRHARVRKKIAGTAETPRFSVYRSLNHIYVQVIDDVKGVTLVSASTMEKAVKEKIKDLTKTEAAKIVGEESACGRHRNGRIRQGRLHLYGPREERCGRRKRSRA